MTGPNDDLKTPASQLDIEPSAPEVTISYGAAGHDETFAALEEEVSDARMSEVEAPVIEITESPAGRETLAAIAEELADPQRPRQETVHYGDRISNAPGARLPSRLPTPPKETPSAPLAEAAPQPTPQPSPPRATLPEATAAPEIFELLTFIVRGSSAYDLSNDALRRSFVQQHLLHRLPSASLDAVERIEVTPWTAKGTTVVRIWCRA